MKKILRLIGFNALSLLILLLIANLPLFIDSSRKTSKRSKDALPSAFQDDSFYEKWRKEYSEIEFDYFPYIGWRRKPYSSTYTNILPEYRTRNSIDHSIDDGFWFFGGSSMWGDGSSDEGTIPSWFAKINNTNVANFGEAGYSARQSLNLLLTLISEGNRPRGIIFFEGSNDVGYQCLRENSFLPAHGRSDLFRDQVSQSLRSKITGKVFYLANNYRDNLFNSYRRLLGLKESTDRATALLTLYDCHSNSEKARRVAQHIFNDWKMAYLLANDLGVPFRAILQPTVFSSKDQERHIKYRDFYNVHSMNISAVYPIVNELMEKYCADTNKTCSNAFIDGRHWINTDKPIFFDHIHVNSEGNRIIAEQIANALER